MQFLKIRLVLIALLIYSGAYAQDREQDSLLSIVKTGNPKERTDALNTLCLNLVYNEPARAKQYAFQAAETAGAAVYKEGEGRAYLRLGIVYDVTGDYDSAVYFNKIALDICLKNKNAKGAGSAYSNLGLISGKRGKLSEAIDFFFKALPCFESIDNKEMLAHVHNNIALTYSRTGDYRKAIRYALKAIAYYRGLNDEENIGGTYTNLGTIYEFLFKYDSAGYYLKQAITYNKKANNLYGLSTAYIDYAALHSEYLKDYKTAHEYYSKALSIKTELGDYEGISCVLSGLADNYRRSGDRHNQRHYLLKAFELSKEKQFRNEILTTSKALAGFYRASNNADSVFYYLSLYNAAKDSVYTNDLKQSLAEAQTKYETKEKELTIQKQQYQLTFKNYYIIGLFIVMLFGVFVFYTFYNRYRMRQKSSLQQEIIRQQDLATNAVIRAEENERKRVASDLHDSVGQMLSAVKLNLSVLSPDILPANAAKFEKIIVMVDESCREVRAISHNMMPNSLLKNGLVSAIREFIGQLNHSSLTVNVETSGLGERLDDNLETVLYRIVQECVNNVVKHAKASRLDIQLVKDKEGIAITIEDNGIGFDTGIAVEGIGLKNLRSRIGFLKGHVDISSKPAKGTLIAIFIPQQNKS